MNTRGIVLMVLFALLSGCAGSMKQRGDLDGSSATKARLINTHRVDDLPASPTTGIASSTPTASPCRMNDGHHRVRDLTQPWAKRRYLLSDGTLYRPEETEIRR